MNADDLRRFARCKVLRIGNGNGTAVRCDELIALLVHFGGPAVEEDPASLGWDVSHSGSLVPNDCCGNIVVVESDQRGPASATAERLAAELDVARRLDDLDVDTTAMAAVSNIYRAASSVRRRGEREVLAPVNLSWGGFTILWVLWIWGDMETGQLAAECDLAKGTLSGMLTTLEKRDLVRRTTVPEDRRRVVVELLEPGSALIEDVYPRFNNYEAEVTADLTDEEARELARLLRKVITRSAPPS